MNHQTERNLTVENTIGGTLWQWTKILSVEC